MDPEEFARLEIQAKNGSTDMLARRVMQPHPKRSVFAKTAWLTRKTTVEDAEEHYQIHNRRICLAGDRMWERLKSLIQVGDELWEFSSPDSSWQALAGTAGIALVREGDIIYTVVTLLN